MVRPEELKYDERGLVPCIVQDAATGEVLMLAWQTREALERTLRTGSATFFSRSRGEIWVKGATSGNTQALRGARADCDHDAVLLRVVPAGPACHTGARSCFFEAVEGAPESAEAPGETLARLEQLLRERQSDPPPGSYTARLYADENLRHKKIGEEATELVMASLRGEKDAVASEGADVLYHLLVLLQSHGLGLRDVADKLREREGRRRNPA
jgi:phosphoribosyl-AMP cyclohydrolase / phosphoribosyl-ATP pyrophosphohydrolase